MKQNKKINVHISKLKFLYFLNALSLILIIVLGCFSYILWRSYEQLRDVPNSASTMIVRIVEGLNKPVAIDAKTGIGYLHESRFMLPVTSDIEASDFVYAYQTAQTEGDFPEVVSIAYKPKIEEAKGDVLAALNIMDSFENVPKLQACARGYKVYFAVQNDTTDRSIFEKTLADGRRIYVYKEDACMEDNHQEIVAYLQKIESY